MKTVEFKVAKHVNYDAKMAGKIVTALSDVSSNVFIMSANSRVNAKSIIGVISLALKPGDKFAVCAQGSDADVAINIVKELIAE
ncbi:MAG: HPr family phosphocarrier protein [Clostridia bacterium]|nr:HPr family phosphocarrier protein [Clostridia bacterium]